MEDDIMLREDEAQAAVAPVGETDEQKRQERIRRMNAAGRAIIDKVLSHGDEEFLTSLRQPIPQ
jgi:hypothetical protein